MIPLPTFVFTCVVLLGLCLSTALWARRFGYHCALWDKGYLVQAGIEYLTALREAERGATPGSDLQLELVIYRATCPSYQGRKKLPTRVVGTASLALDVST